MAKAAKRRPAGGTRAGSGEGALGALGARIDALYRVPPAEFIARRNALSRALSAEGHPAQAREVKALARPSLALWTVNQLARQAPGAVARLLEAWEKASQAQAQALARGERGALKEALAAERDAVRALLASGEAEPAVAASARRHAEQVAGMISAAVRADDQTRQALQRGALREAPVLSAFGLPIGPGPTSRRGAAPAGVPSSRPASTGKPGARPRASARAPAAPAPGDAPHGRRTVHTQAPVEHQARTARADAARKEAAARREETAEAARRKAADAKAQARHRREQAQLRRELDRAHGRQAQASRAVRAAQARLQVARAREAEAREAVHAAEARQRALTLRRVETPDA